MGEEDQQEFVDLRRRAEEILRGQPVDVADFSPKGMKRLVHELQAHQIELQLQNEELRRTQQAFADSRERYEDLFNLAPVGYFTLDEDGRILDANLTAATMLGYGRGELLKRLWIYFINPNDRDIYYRHRQQLLKTAKPQRCELRLVRKEGTPFYVRLDSIAILMGKADAYQVRMAVSDIGERKRVEQERTRLFEAVSRQRKTLKTQAQRLRQLAQQVVTAQEEERRRVSHELHDQAGQALTALKYSLAAALSILEKEETVEPEALRGRLKEAVALCEETMSQVRLLAHDLRPTTLDNVGLNLTLEGFCRDFAERTGLVIEYEGVEVPALPETAGISLYRVLQEALTNVAKHAHASHVWVRLHATANVVTLSVEDDGRGFEQPVAGLLSDQEKGIGLLGMHERMEALGGRLQISSQCCQGTRLTVSIPR